jgi:hypothetical protein
VLSGSAYLDAKDVTSGLTFDDHEFLGTGTETLNPFTQTVESLNVLVNYIDPDAGASIGLDNTATVSVTEFGSGFANQLVDVWAAVPGELGSFTDTLITPFGDFTLFSF